MRRPLLPGATSLLRSGLLAAVGAILAAKSLAAAAQPDVRARVVAPQQLNAGAPAVVVVEMTVGSGWHVNSHTPSEKYLIPTDVALKASAGTLSAIRYPRDVEKRFAFSDKPLRVYEGTVRFEADLSAPDGASGEASIQGELSYQACNDQQCFAPAKLPLTARVTIRPNQPK